MRSILHLLVTTGLFIFLWILFDAITITSIIPGIYLAFAIDMTIDAEAGTMSYKMYMTHSTIMWIVIYLFNPMSMTALMCLAVAVHCLMDIYPGSPDVPRKNYNSWLFGNGTIGIILFLLYIISIL